MFKIFLDNLQLQITKFQTNITNLHDCTIDKISTYIEEGESLYEESLRTVSNYDFYQIFII